MQNSVITLELRITGRVQGVGFRYFTLMAAQRLGVNGWAKNMPDGSVLIHAHAERAVLDDFKAEVGRGPVSARVAAIDEKPIDAGPPYHSFDITY